MWMFEEQKRRSWGLSAGGQSVLGQGLARNESRGWEHAGHW